MNIRQKIRGCWTGILMLVVLLATAGPSAAIEYNLAATATTMNYAGADIPMWGFALCTDNTFASCGPVTVPGPPLTVPPGEGLTINLKNNLTIPVSIVIPGQSITPSPTDVGGRVMSFTTETAAGGTGIYTWNNFKPGTYLYQSGTNPAVQVQMGLYGAVKKDFAASQAYDSPAAQYNNDVILLFSEIDPALHTAIDAAVSGGQWGTSNFPSTIDFKPKYFLINGAPFTVGSPHISAGTAGQRILLRFLNAGLRDYVPVLQGLHMTILTEDGNLLPYSKSQYSLILPAGKTTDAMITPAIGTYALYDRRLNLTSGASSPGGMLTYLDVTAANQPPTANAGGPYSGTAGTPIAFDGTGSSDPEGAALTYSWDFGDGSPAGSGATPSHTYAAAGAYTVTLTVNDGVQDSSPATTTANVAAVSDPIFADGFESGDFSAWSAEQDGQGDLNVTAAAARSSSFGMAALIDNNTNMWVRSDTPVSEPRYRARFYFDPNSIPMANNNVHRIMAARSGDVNAGVEVVRIEFRWNSTLGYQIRGAARYDAGGYLNSPWFAITDDWHSIEIDWQAATAAGANNGSLSLWIDGVLMQTLSGIDNDTLRVESVRLGPLNGIDTGTRGTTYFDDFVSRRTSYIGP